MHNIKDTIYNAQFSDIKYVYTIVRPPPSSSGLFALLMLELCTHYTWLFPPHPPAPGTHHSIICV